MHPDDAQRLGLADGGAARLRSAAGEIEAPVEMTDAVMPGVVSVPHGWGHDAPGMRMRVAGAHPGVNSNVLADDGRDRAGVGQRGAERDPGRGLGGLSGARQRGRASEAV